ncbi:hypothetical protein [Afifella sp. IM 167]|uniref:hypothetical protein n=1 Tax=Afifella sp. IM 167 TaxID=2033586 RepID=UPI001CCD97B1|nr:hypothetical protein [Afifella sp. IM 167]MBZ8133214.1 hypothetical protein [Afifella sp. IM 167]
MPEAYGVRIDDLDPAASPDRDFLLPAMKGGTSQALSIAQILGLALAAEIAFDPDEGPLTAETVQTALQELAEAVGSPTDFGRVLIALADLGELLTTIGAFEGDEGSGGAPGLVPAPGGGDAAKVLTGAGSWATRVFKSEYASAPQIITTSGSLTLAHGLGAVPKLVVAELVCGTAEHGYSVGDIVPIFSPGGTATGTTDNPTSNAVFVKGATNVSVYFGSGTSVFQLPHKTFGLVKNLTNGSWTLVVRAFA